MAELPSPITTFGHLWWKESAEETQKTQSLSRVTLGQAPSALSRSDGPLPATEHEIGALGLSNTCGQRQLTVFPVL